MSVVMHTSGQECWGWSNRLEFKCDQVSGVMLKGENKVMW